MFFSEFSTSNDGGRKVGEHWLGYLGQIPSILFYSLDLRTLVTCSDGSKLSMNRHLEELVITLGDRCIQGEAH